MLSPYPNRLWQTVLSHCAHVAIDGGPREFGVKPLACSATAIAGLMLSNHHGMAITKASNPAFRCEAKFGIPNCRRSPAISENVINGSTIARNEAFDNNPIPMASPRPIQLLLCSGFSV